MLRLIEIGVVSIALSMGAGATSVQQDSTPLDVATSLSEKGHYASAIQILTGVIETVKDDLTQEQAYFLRAEAKFGIGFESPGDDNPTFSAIGDYSEAIRRNPSNQLYWRERATAHASLGGYEEALSDLDELRKLEAANGAPFWSLVRIGGIKRVFGEYESAIKLFDEAIANVSPTPVMPANYHKAITLLRMGENERAILAIDEGLNAQQNYASAFDFRACAKANLGRFDEALEDLQVSEKLSAAYPAPEAKLPSVEHDLKIEAERRSYLADIIAGREKPSKMRLEDLCFSNWWMMHFQTPRERSSLLGAR